MNVDVSSQTAKDRFRTTTDEGQEGNNIAVAQAIDATHALI